MYLSTCLPRDKRSGREIDGGVVSKKIEAPDVPGREVEQLVLAEDLTQHLAALRPFLLVI